MPNLWLHLVGSVPPRSDSKGIEETLAVELEKESGSPVRIDVWQPFQQLPPAQELPYIMLLVGSNRKQDQQEYFAISGALALHLAGQAVLIPIILRQDELLRDPEASIAADPWAKRCGDLMGRVMRLDPLFLPQTEPWYRGLGPAVWDAVRKGQRPVPPGAGGPVTVFFSYSHRDETLRDDLARHLKLLERTGLIKGWHDRRIAPGDDWAADLDQHLYTSDLILLLLSSDFFASDYCYEIEVPVAVERHRRNAARAIPIVLRPVIWHESALAAFQALPTDGRPVIMWEPMDSAFVNVCEGIVSSALAWKDRRPPEVTGGPDYRGSFDRLFSTRKRMLDAAFPAAVEVDNSAMLVVLVRTAASGGLRALVAVDSGYGLAVEDVQSKPISLQFPLNEAKKPASLTLTVRVQSPDFWPSLQEKRLLVPPEGDSQPCILMLAAGRPGHLTAAVELYNGDQLITASPIRTLATTTPVAGGARCNIASSAFEVDQSASRVWESAAAAATGDVERPGDFTRLMRQGSAPPAAAGDVERPGDFDAFKPPPAPSPAPQAPVPSRRGYPELGSDPGPVKRESPSYSSPASSPAPARSSRPLGPVARIVLLLGIIALGYLVLRLLK